MSWAAALSWLYGAGRWVRDNFSTVLLFIIGAGVGARLLKRKDSEISTLKEAINANSHQAAIENLKGRREQLMAGISESAQRDHALAAREAEYDKQIAEHQRAIIALHDKRIDPNVLTDTEVEEYFKRAGL